MSRANSAVVLLIALGVSACASLDDFAMPALKKQAAIDMSCSADQLKVSETEQWHYAVDGCNKHGAYVMEMCNKVTRNCVFLTEAQYIATKSPAPQVQTPQSKDAQLSEKNRQIARQKEADQQRKQAGESEAQFRKRLDDQRRDWDRQDQQRRDEDRRRQQQLDEQRRQDQARQDQQRQEQERRQRDERNRQQQSRKY